MFSKSALVLAALVSTLAIGAAAPAKADPSISFGIGFESDPWAPVDSPDPYFIHRHRPHPYHFADPGYGDTGYGYGDAGYGDHGFGDGGGWRWRHRFDQRLSCWQGADVLRQRGFHGVRPTDCSAPVYEYRGWKHGQPFDIQLSMRGNFLGASPSDW